MEENANIECVFLHLFTNDVQNHNPIIVCDLFESLIQKIKKKFPQTKVIVSLGIPRGDSDILNNTIRTVNITLQHRFLELDFVTFCENASLGIHGQPNAKFLSKDLIHLNFQGTGTFGNNMKYSIKKALKIRQVQGNYRHRYDRPNMNIYGQSKFGYKGPYQNNNRRNWWEQGPPGYYPDEYRQGW